MDMLGKVRRMKMRDKLTISEISKRTGLARNTVKRWLKAPGDVSPRYLRFSVVTKLSAYEATLVMALKADANRHKDLRRLARALLKSVYKVTGVATSRSRAIAKSWIFAICIFKPRTYMTTRCNRTMPKRHRIRIVK
jgi:hypothetical protein